VNPVFRVFDQLDDFVDAGLGGVGALKGDTWLEMCWSLTENV